MAMFPLAVPGGLKGTAMAKRGIDFNEGLNLDATLEQLGDAWRKEYGSELIDVALEAHRLRHAADAGADEIKAEMWADCRQCGLAMALSVLRRFRQRDRPLAERASKIKEAASLLEQLAAVLRELEPYPGPEERAALEGLRYLVRSQGDVLERVPSAVRELNRRKGRPVSVLVQQLVWCLNHGGFGWDEIAALVVDEGGPEGRTKRLQEALRTVTGKASRQLRSSSTQSA